MARERFLSDYERQSAFWKKLATHMTERLASLRARNDAVRSPEKTNLLRGQIAELKHLLSLADDKPSPPPEDVFKD